MSISAQVDHQVLSATARNDYKQWDELVSMSPTPDIYFRPGYALAYADESASAIALLLHVSNRRFLVPLLLRRLSTLPYAAMAPDYDALTPYGYGGVLPLDPGGISQEHAQDLLRALKEWCGENHVVSCLLRLHPLLQQGDQLAAAALLTPGVELREHGLTTAIDLEAWEGELRAPASLNDDRRRNLRLARRRLSVTIAPCDTPEGLSAVMPFRAVYNETMLRLGASSHYFFREEYFLRLIDALGRRMAVAIARFGDKVAGAALFFADDLFAHYHLSGTTADGRRLKASSLLLVSGAEWARNRGCRALHLGGGLAANDSLSQFKMSFGGSTHSYSFVTVNANPARYSELVQLRNADMSMVPLRDDFFPEYRA